jgi:hypothetical protein
MKERIIRKEGKGNTNNNEEELGQDRKMDKTENIHSVRV